MSLTDGLPGRLAACLYRGYYTTLKVEGLLADGTRCGPTTYRFAPDVFVLSERDALALGGLIANSHFTVLVAHGWDGDWATSLLDSLGFSTIRGSSLSGGARALGGLLRAGTSSPDPIAIVADGPLGPQGVAKPGPVLCGLRTGRAIRALGVASRRRIPLGTTWSGIYFPMPFTRVVVAADDPLPLPATWEKRDVAPLTAALTERLAAMSRRARAALDGTLDVAGDRLALTSPQESA